MSVFPAHAGMNRGAAQCRATIHSSLADTYNRSRYLSEVGDALQKWADWIDELVPRQ
jgi:hypothetical protein